jgi:hypothetical protein
MLTLIIGTLGSGKTLFATIIACHTPSSTNIFANYELRLPNYTPLEPELLMQKDTHGLIIIDEAYVWLESRTSGNKANRYLSYILYQSRKKGFNFILTAQNISSVDRRYREQADIIVLCNNNAKKQRFEYFIYKKQFLSYLKAIRYLSYANAEKYYKYYDTAQLVMPPAMKKLSYSFILNDNDKLDKLINKICSELHYIDKITKDNIERELIKLDYPKELAKYVYAQLKQKRDAEQQ